MYKLRRKIYSQNFLYSRKLVAKLLGYSSISKNDLVLEIGPGKGIITEHLLQQARQIIAIEIDSHWYNYLKQKFANNKNLTLFQKNFLDFILPPVPYKVFANIPFSIEGKIIRTLIDAQNPPEDCYLVMMKEVAYRLSAPYKDNMFSIIHKPWFDFSIYHKFRRTDFEPVPNVDIVMLRFKKRSEPLLKWDDHFEYQRFVKIGFGHGQPLKNNLIKHYGKQKVLRYMKALKLYRSMKPGFLSLDQWINLYISLASSNPRG